MISRTISMTELLSNRNVTFFIPPYQRNYEWTKEQCKVMWEDIVLTIERAKSEESRHFFGTITLFQTGMQGGAFGLKRLVLVDGQQRVTSIMLLLLAIRDTCKDALTEKAVDEKTSVVYKGLIDEIESSYLKNERVSEEEVEYKIKLKQIEKDDVTFRSLILGNEHLADKESNVYKNYMYFKSAVNEYIKIDGNRIEDVFQVGINNFEVLDIELEISKKWENPQEIFESLNSMGKPLSLSDLVRNYLMLGQTAAEQNTLYEQYWLPIEKNAGDMSAFIRDFIQSQTASREPNASEKNYKALYRRFKDVFEGESVSVLLEKMKRYSIVYSWVIRKGNSECQKVNRLLLDLDKLKTSTVHSFLMVVLDKYRSGAINEEGIVETLTALRTYFLRRDIAQARMGENNTMPTLIKHVNELVSAENKEDYLLKLLGQEEFRLRVPNDNEVRHYLETMDFYSLSKAKFFLLLIEEGLTKGASYFEDSSLTKEHILPQTPTKEWAEMFGGTEAEYEAYVNRIGNITLIRHNQELSNKPFAEKKQTYDEREGLQISRCKIIDHDSWDKDAIAQRGTFLTDILLEKVAPLPAEMKTKNNYRREGRRGFSFTENQLLGENIFFKGHDEIHAEVVEDKKVLYDGKQWELTPLTNHILSALGENKETHSPYEFWTWDGVALSSWK